MPPPTQEQIQEAARRLAESSGTSTDWLPYITRNGRYFWRHSYGAIGPNGTDLDAWNALVEWITGLDDDHENKQRLIDMLTVPSVAAEMLANTRWVDQGCPIVQTTHRFAAAAICTRLPADIELHTPWRAWVLEVPDRLLTVTDPKSNNTTWVRYCLVRMLESDDGPLWSLTGMSANNRHQLGSRNLTAQQLLIADPTTASPDIEPTVLDWDLDDETDRVIVCLKRLVTNLLVTMTHRPECAQQVGIHRTTDHASLRRGEDPRHRRWMVRSDVAIDLRQEVRDYCAGTRRGATPTVQTLCRGHWRHVVHGAQRAERRLQFIAPFWRGPLDAPIKSPTVKVE